jgi:hypothetical protein
LVKQPATLAELSNAFTRTTRERTKGVGCHCQSKAEARIEKIGTSFASASRTIDGAVDGLKVRDSPGAQTFDKCLLESEFQIP